MRFISKYDNYSICYQRDVINYFGDGNSQEVKPLLNCQFRVAGLNPWEMEAARAQFINRGLGTYEDHVTPEDPAGRFSVFDTVSFQGEHSLDDGTREKIENWLLNERWECGTHYIHVEAPKLTAPWPNYDDLPAENIAALAINIGCLPEALAYEKANLNRPEVIAEIEECMAPDPSDDPAELIAA